MTTTRDARGFALVSVLFIVGLVVAVSMTYLRHTLAESESSLVSRPAWEARESAESSFQYAQQALLSGKPFETSSSMDMQLAAGQQATADLHIAALSDERSEIRVRSLDGHGLGSTTLAETARVRVAEASEPNTLPRLSADAIATLMADAGVPKTYHTSDALIKDADLFGLIVLRAGCSLTFDNVVVHGAILSEDVLSGADFGPFDASTRPQVLIDGNLRIEPGAYLPGVALLLPDGEVLTWDTNSVVQFRGDTVAHRIELDCAGFVTGNTAAVEPLVASAGLELLASGRGPLDWADAIDLGDNWDMDFLAILPRYSTIGELDAITRFSFAEHFDGAITQGTTAPQP